MVVTCFKCMQRLTSAQLYDVETVCSSLRGITSSECPWSILKTPLKGNFNSVQYREASKLNLMSPWTGCMCYFWSKVAVSLIFIYLQECPVLSHLVDLKITGCFFASHALLGQVFPIQGRWASRLSPLRGVTYSSAEINRTPHCLISGVSDSRCSDPGCKGPRGTVR
jgi:hypothetical protein